MGDEEFNEAYNKELALLTLPSYAQHSLLGGRIIELGGNVIFFLILQNKIINVRLELSISQICGALVGMKHGIFGKFTYLINLLLPPS